MLWQYDLCNFGVLCKRIRLSRGVEPKDIAERYGLSPATITRIEKGNGNKRESFEKYVAALQSTLAFPPLSSVHAENLLHLYDYSRPQKLCQLEEEVAAISFQDIKTAHSHRDKNLGELLELFKAQNRPALIMDDLWFDHAINGALLELFNLDAHASYMYQWETWNSLAIKLNAAMPVLDYHEDFDYVLPPNVQLFFDHAHRYLFTTQMRHLVHRLMQLSMKNNLKFDCCWEQTLTYSFPYSPNTLMSIPRQYMGETDTNGIRVEVQVQGTYPITFDDGYSVNYRLMTWNPVPGHEYTENRFKQIRQSTECHKIYYACDYDKHNSFHVNTWPEVEKAVMTRF